MNGLQKNILDVLQDFVHASAFLSLLLNLIGFCAFLYGNFEHANLTWANDLKAQNLLKNTNRE